MAIKNRTYRVSDSDEKKRYLICISRDECYPMSDKNGNFLFTKKEAIDNGVKYCEDFVLNNSEIGERFQITVEENTDEWSVEDIENKHWDTIDITAKKRTETKADIKVTEWTGEKNVVLRDDEMKRINTQSQRKIKKIEKESQKRIQEYEEFVNAVKAYRQSNGQSSTDISDSNKRMYRMNQVQDGLWDGIKRFFGGGNRQVESRDVETDYEQGDRIRFRRQNGQKATGIIENVYWNEDEQAVDYGVHSSITLDNVVVPEENVIGDSKNNNNMFKNRMYRVSDGLDEPLPYTGEHPSTDWEYWGVKETTLKNVKPGDWFTLKPIPEPKESQVWIKGGYNRADRDYTCERYNGGGERFFKPDRKVYVDFYF